MKETKTLYAIELGLGSTNTPHHPPAPRQHWEWVLHSEQENDGQVNLCVYDTLKDAKVSAEGRDHAARIVLFTRSEVFKGRGFDADGVKLKRQRRR